MEINVYILALGANLCFALGSQVFTHYSRAVSARWMNFFKASIAMVLFGVSVTVLDQWHPITSLQFGLFFLSGFIGLGIGDIFLLKAFAELGPGRTLMLFSFQPLYLGVMSYFFLDQTIDSKKFYAILLFVICLGIFSLEGLKKDKSWRMKGIAIALLGIILDGTGVLITRYSFDMNPALTSFEGNFYRTLGAVSVFIILSRIKPIHLVGVFKGMAVKSRVMVVLGSILGTYLSLSLYLMAIQEANLASLAGVSITGTIFSSIFECLIEKKWPSKYLVAAFGAFLIGMKILVL